MRGSVTGDPPRPRGAVVGAPGAVVGLVDVVVDDVVRRAIACTKICCTGGSSNVANGWPFARREVPVPP